MIKTGSKIMIVGCPRSGTTLLRTMLDRHPSLLVHPEEPLYLMGLYKKFGYKIKDVPFAVNYVGNHQFLPKTIDKEKLNLAYKDIKIISLKDFISRYLSVWAGEDLGSRITVIKVPTYIFYLGRVNDLFGRLIVIHVIRDPRANVSSQHTRWPQLPVIECATSWKRSIILGRKWACQKKTPYIEVQYEQLLQSPENALRKLCERLDIPYTDGMLSFEQVEEVFSPGSTVPENTRFTKVDSSRNLLWHDRLNPMDVHLIEFICKKEMALLNYELTESKVPQVVFIIRLIKEHLYYNYLKTGRFVKQQIFGKIKME